MATQATVVDRLFGWLLDHDGDLYGDEQERLRWYEGSAAVLPLQTIAVSWAAAAAALVGNRATAWTLLAVLLALYLPLFLLKHYVERRHVRTVLVRWGRKRITLTALTVLPYLVAVVAMARDFPLSGSFQVGMAVGAVLGVVMAARGLAASRRRERAHELGTPGAE